MDQLRRFYPGLVMDHVRTVASMIADQRNLVRKVNACFRRARWGHGCMAADVARDYIEQIDRDGTYPWLRFVKESNLGYTLLIDGVPLRVQRDYAEIKSVLPGEREAMSQVLLADMPDPGVILRMEITRPSGEPVHAMALHMYEEHSGARLDCEVVYQRPIEGVPANDTTAADSGPNAAVLQFARPAQDADPKNLFAFDDQDAAKDGDGDDDE